MHQSVNIPIKLDQPKSQQQPQNADGASGNKPKRPSVMERLRALEAEMSVEAAGLQLPEDPELTEKLSTFLAAQHPDADLQITVSSVRKTTTTKQQYETETPGMVGLEVDKLMDLQRKLMAKISANKLAEEAEAAEKQQLEHPAEEEWARRGPPDVQRSETVEEAFPLDQGAQMITKKRTHVVTMSQSRAQGLDELPMAPPAPGTQSFHGVTLHSTGPPQKEDTSLSLSLSTSSTSSGSVKDKVAKFESMKSKEEAEEAAKKRFGWRGSMVSPPGKRQREDEEQQQEEARKSPSRIPTRTTTTTSPLPSPTRERRAEEIGQTKKLEETNVVTLIELEKEPMEMREEATNIVKAKMEYDFVVIKEEKPFEGNEEIKDMAPEILIVQSEEGQQQGQQPSMGHAEIIDVAPEIVISHQESQPEMQAASAVHIETLDSAPIVEIAETERQSLIEPISIIIEPPSAVHEPSPPESPENEKKIEFEKKEFDEEIVEPEEFTKKDSEMEESREQAASSKNGQYMPFGAEIVGTNVEEHFEEKPKIVATMELEPHGIEGKPKEPEILREEVIERIEEEPMKLRRISMDTDREGGIVEEEMPKQHFEQPEAIEEKWQSEGRPELFVTTGLNVQRVEPTQNIEIKVVEPEEEESKEEEPELIENFEATTKEEMPSESKRPHIEEEEGEEKKMEENIEDEVIYEIGPEKREIQSAIWLENAPTERCPYEEEELAEKKALLWPEEEENLQSILGIAGPLMATMPWFIGREDGKEERGESPEQKMPKIGEEMPGIGAEDGQRHFEEEMVVSSKYVPAHGIQVENVAPATPQKVPPPLSPLQSEESIGGGGGETEDDERSSTHTVIHRPEMLVDTSTEDIRTRSLYGRTHSDLDALEGQQQEQAVMDEQTPTSPVMNAARWKSLDERSSDSPAAKSPSPLIEITPAPVEKEEDDGENLERNVENEEKEMERKTEIEEQKEIDEIEKIEEMENEKDEENAEPAEILMGESAEPMHAESILIVEREEEADEIPHQEIKESQEGKEESEREERTSFEEPEEPIVQTKTDEEELHGGKQEQDAKLEPELVEEDEEFLVESEPIEMQEKETMEMHFDEEGHSPIKHQESPVEKLDEEEGNKNEEEFELVETQKFVPMEEKLQQMESFDHGMRHSEKEERIEEAEKQQILEFELAKRKEEEGKIEGEKFSEKGEEESPQFSKTTEDLPAKEEQKELLKMDDTEEMNEDFEKKLAKNLDEIRNKEETTALGLVTARQAELLVEDVINKVLEEGVIPSPEGFREEAVLMDEDEEEGPLSPEPSPEPTGDDWEMVEGENGGGDEVEEKKKMEGNERMEELPQGMSGKDGGRIEQQSRESGEAKESPISLGNEDEEEEEPELVQLQFGGRKNEKGEEEEEEFEEEEDDIVPEQPEEYSSTAPGPSTTTFLSLATPVHRPKSPIPPPAAPTPPQSKPIEKEMLRESSMASLEESTSSEAKQIGHKKEEMEESINLLDEGFTKMPEDVLDLGEESSEEMHHRNIHAIPLQQQQQRIQSPPEELEKIHEQMLASGNLLAEEGEAGDSPSSGGAGNSLGSSPAKKRRSTSSSVHAGNGGGGSAEGSLLEFERIEQEIIGQEGEGGEMEEDLAAKRKEEEIAQLTAAAAVAAARGSVESISGSISSLTEFEQLEKEVREAVSASDEIMILSDIREESEEGALEEEAAIEERKSEDEEEELERMSTREDDDEEEEMGEESGKEIKEEMGKKSGEIERKKSAEIGEPHLEELAVEKEMIMLSSADSLEVEKQPFGVEFVQEGQKMETSVDSLEMGNLLERAGEMEKEDADSLEGHEGAKEEFGAMEKDALNILPIRGNGNGSPSDGAAQQAEEEAERTTFETVRINPMDGREERLIRTAITRVRDPIHSRVRFVGTEDEQRVQAILEGRGGGGEMETTDEEGNVTRVRTIVEREIVH